ncbi:MAG: TolC family protein [Bacteroidota bacterium]
MRFYFLLLGLFLLACPLLGQSDGVLSLKESLELGLENSTAIQKTKIEGEIASKKVQAQKSVFLPQIRGFADYTHFFDNQTYIFPGSFSSLANADGGSVPIRLGAQSNLSAGISLQQRLFDRKWVTGKKQLEIFDETQDVKLTIVQEEIIYNIAKLFYEYASLNLKNDLLDFSKERLEKTAEIVEAQVDADIIHPSVLKKLRLKQKELDLSKKKLRSGIATQKKALQDLIGTDKDLSYSWEQQITVLAEELPEIEKNSKDQELIALKKSANSLEQQNIKSDFFPKVNFVANLQYQYMGDQFSPFQGSQWFPLNFIGINMDFPIFVGNKKNIQLEEKVLERDLLKIEEEDERKKRNLMLRSKEASYQSAFDKFLFLKEEKNLKSELYELNKLQYSEGILGLNELLESESELLKSEERLKEGFLDLKIAELDYFKEARTLNLLLE